MIFRLDLVRAVAAEHPELLEANTGASCHAFTTLVLARLKAEGYPGWGYIGKIAGEGQYRPSVGFPRQIGAYRITGVSHDAIGNGMQRVDVLGGSNDGPELSRTPATPIWLDIPPENWRPHNPIIPFDGPVTPPAPTIPSYESLGGDTFFRAMVGVPLAADMAVAGQPLNDGSSVWFARLTYRLMAAYVVGGQVDSAPIVKSVRNEWRAILGLPPL